MTAMTEDANTLRMRLGMLLFVVSESVFFLLLILAFAFFHKPGSGVEQASALLSPVKTGLFSLALFSSSATMWLAGLSRRKGRRGAVRFWLFSTIALGTVFLVGQGREYAGLLEHHVTISQNVFGTTFFTLTGFHGFHVLGGLVLLSILLGLALFGTPREPARPAMDAISIYWHFVDGVWVVIFSVVYLWRFV
jgi:heme/copper-type cytochrome/quinol oxidase subunit 3